MEHPPPENPKYPWIIFLPWQIFYCKHCSNEIKLHLSDEMEDEYKRFVLYHKFCKER
jgi:hypothetical protein